MTSPSAGPPAVRRATLADLDTMARTLAAAFDDDPIYNWVMRQDARRAQAMHHFFTEEVREYLDAPGATAAGGYDATKQAWTTGTGDGVALWSAPPGGHRLSIAELLRAAPVFLPDTGLARLPRLLWLLHATEAKYPRIPHWYLCVLGVGPSTQGTGVGSALVRTVLDEADRDRLPAYVESSKERNLPFYERHGFRVVERLDFPLRGPSLGLMWREPR